jgi:hypothetical protein
MVQSLLILAIARKSPNVPPDKRRVRQDAIDDPILRLPPRPGAPRNVGFIAFVAHTPISRNVFLK